jgi:two-component system OmpR family response regulator
LRWLKASAAAARQGGPDFTPGGPAIRILLVEDDDELARRIGQALEGAGFAVDRAADGENGWAMGDEDDYDAAVLDLGLPGLPGLEVLRRWRARQRAMPVLVLTARNTWPERVAGLNAGADDYMGKPFQAAELVARLNALLRRASGQASPILQRGGLTLDTTASVATIDGRTVELTATELRVLTLLLQRAGRFVSQSELAERAYPRDGGRESNTMEVFVARLRRKLGRDVIRTSRGLGYRID